jgi:hypothetical protein
MTTKSPLQKILQGILYIENENKQNHERTGVPKHRRKDKETESNTDSAAHNQILKQHEELNDRNHYISINTNTDC